MQGGVAMSLGTSLWILIVARVLNGLAAGLATVVVPLYLSEISPPAIAGSVGKHPARGRSISPIR
jgi:MFS family permease